MAEEFSWVKKLNLKPKIKAKSTNLRELLGEAFDNYSVSDLDIVDVKVVKDPIRIRIDQ
jgi:hypothetical protein